MRRRLNEIFHTETHKSIHTCWWTSAIDKVNCRNTLTVAKTTAPFACWSLSSRRFIISNISLLSEGMYLATNSSTRHCAHSLNSLMLQVKNIRNWLVFLNLVFLQDITDAIFLYLMAATTINTFYSQIGPELAHSSSHLWKYHSVNHLLPEWYYISLIYKVHKTRGYTGRL